LANRYVNGKELDSSEFSGGQEVNSFLERLGLEVSQKGVKPSSTVKKVHREEGLRHYERCPECKKTIKILLERLYGNVETNYQFEVGASLEEFKDSALHPYLKEVFLDLQNHRGHSNFARSQRLPRCDFFIPNPGVIVEFDESQHFTACRKIALSKYPLNFELGFDREKWIKLCEKIDARGNGRKS
jgi:hypothetical protein